MLRCGEYWWQYWRLQMGIVDGSVIRGWFPLHMIQCQACREWWQDVKRRLDQAAHP